jgi:hypothetical protein
VAPNGKTRCAKFLCSHVRNRHPDNPDNLPFGTSAYTPTTQTDHSQPLAPNGTITCAKFLYNYVRNRHPDNPDNLPFGTSAYTPTTQTDHSQPLAPNGTITCAKFLYNYVRNRHPDSPGHMQIGTANTPINQPYSSPSTHARAKWPNPLRQFLTSLYKESAPRQSGPPSFRHRPTTRSKHHLSRWCQMAKHALPIFNVAMSRIGLPSRWRQMEQPLVPNFCIIIQGIGTQTVRATWKSARPIHRSTTPTHHLARAKWPNPLRQFLTSLHKESAPRQSGPLAFWRTRLSVPIWVWAPTGVKLAPRQSGCQIAFYSHASCQIKVWDHKRAIWHADCLGANLPPAPGKLRFGTNSLVCVRQANSRCSMVVNRRNLDVTHPTRMNT